MICLKMLLQVWIWWQTLIQKLSEVGKGVRKNLHVTNHLKVSKYHVWRALKFEPPIKSKSPPPEKENNFVGLGQFQAFFTLFGQPSVKFTMYVLYVKGVEFLGFQDAQKFHLGHFSTALSLQILKISILLLFGIILTLLLPKYYKEAI